MESSKTTRVVVYILSFMDILTGIMSMSISQMAIPALLFTLSTFIICIIEFVKAKKENTHEESIALLGLSILDVLTCTLAIFFAFMMIPIIISKLLKWIKWLKVFIQTKKVKNFWKTIKPVVIIAVATLKGENGKIKKGDVTMSNFLDYLKANKKTISGAIVGIITALGTGGGTAGALMIGNVDLPTFANIIIGAVIAILTAVVNLLGVFGKGKETPEEYAERKEAEAKAKEEKQKLLEAEKEKQAKLAEAKAYIEKQKLAKQKEEEERLLAEYEQLKAQGLVK